MVTFTAPGGGASGTFGDSGTNVTTATTDELGVGTAAAFAANETVGSYIVQATVAGIVMPAEFELENVLWYVATVGNDGNGCQGAGSPCATINGVLGKVRFVAGETVLVGSGTYTGSGSEVVLINKSVRILGGWDTGFTAQTGMSVIDGQAARRGITVNGVIAAIERVQIENGSAGAGGGIANHGDLTIDRSVLRGNTAGDCCGGFTGSGGGIYNSWRLAVVNSTVEENIAFNGDGGGIFNSGMASLSGVSLVGNGVSLAGNGARSGGAIYNRGTLVVTNSTLSGNGGYTVGGGIAQETGTSLLASVVVTGNYSRDGGGLYRQTGDMSVQNSIIARNLSANPGSSNLFTPDCHGTIISLGYNLLGKEADCLFEATTGDLVGGVLSPLNPRLGQLQDNGGSTWTHALVIGSPALDAGNPGLPGSGGNACPATDQRGVPRPQGTRCDIGPFEGSLDDSIGPSLFTLTSTNLNFLPGFFLCSSVAECTHGADPHADAAHRHARDTYDFYQTVHGRDSLDDLGLEIVSTVHFLSGFDNAFWNGSQVVYGDAFGFPLADDVVGHELSHGVTQFESNLFYYYQSGAINESFSDMWGEFVDQTNGAGNDGPAVKWLIGEDVTGMDAIRSLSNPPTFGDPDKITSPNYFKGLADFDVFGDNGGVHTNSGVNNKAAFLLTDGGTFNGYTVRGLGIARVGAIYYEAQTNLLTLGSDYADLYNILFQACQNLMGGLEGITSSDCLEVRDAANAVEMNLQPAAGYNPEPAFCPSGTTRDQTVFSDELESGDGNWTFGAIGGSSVWRLATGFARSGDQMLWGDDFSTFSDSFAAMAIDVPLPAGAFLHFAHAFGFEDPNFDGGVLEYSTNGGATWIDAGSLFSEGRPYGSTISANFGNNLGGRKAFIADSHGYVASRYNLGTLVGKSVQFRFRMGTDDIFHDLGWFVDDVEIYTCVGAAAVPSLVSPASNALLPNLLPTLDWADAAAADPTSFRFRPAVPSSARSSTKTSPPPRSLSRRLSRITRRSGGECVRSTFWIRQALGRRCGRSGRSWRRRRG